MNSYEEKKQMKIDRARLMASKARMESQSAYQAAKQIGDMIPMGQPILVGHHSEGRHRRDIGRIDSNMRKSVEASDKANYYEDKARRLESSNIISSDDPEALQKLKNKLSGLQEAQELYKAINKIVKSTKLSHQEKFDKLMAELPLTEKTANLVLTPDFCGRIGVPSYKLSNNNQNMATIRKRIEGLERRASQETKELEIGGVRIVDNVEENRIQAFFNDKPDDATRAALKHTGFRWAPSNGCWQAYRKQYALDMIKRICETL
jgi:hypothetical protein